MPGYVTSRGLDPTGIGYAPPGWTRTLDHLRAAGFTDDELLAAGLARHQQPRHPDRPVPQPAHAPHPRHRPAASSPSSAAPTPTTPTPHAPKYVNSATTDLFSKTDLPYGLTPETIEQLRGGADLAIVEGPMDALAVNAAAAPPTAADLVAVAPLGTALTAEQLATLNGIAPLRRPHAWSSRWTTTPPAGGPHRGARACCSPPASPTPGCRTCRPGRTPPTSSPTAGAHALAAALGQRRPLADLVVDQVLTAALRGDHSPESRLWALDKTAQVVAADAIGATRPASRPHRPGTGPGRLPRPGHHPVPRALRPHPARPARPAQTAARAAATASGHSCSPATPPGSTPWAPRTGTPIRSGPRGRAGVLGSSTTSARTNAAPTPTAGPTATGNPPARLRRDRGAVVEPHHRRVSPSGSAPCRA